MRMCVFSVNVDVRQMSKEITLEYGCIQCNINMREHQFCMWKRKTSVFFNQIIPLPVQITRIKKK